MNDGYGHKLEIGDPVYFVERSYSSAHLAHGYVLAFTRGLIMIGKGKNDDPTWVWNHKCQPQNVVKDCEVMIKGEA